MPISKIEIFSISGMGEVSPGDDIASLIQQTHEGALQNGDIIVVSSKIVSKAEGRILRAESRDDAIAAETVRVVATKKHKFGTTQIVENRNGLVLAAAGVDASNTDPGTVLLLPLDPDLSASKIRNRLQENLGLSIGVIITDTFGRPWREGQTDVAIGASGVRVLRDYSGSTDAYGNKLSVTNIAVADEIAGAAELVKGKLAQRPVAIVRGLSELVEEEAPGAKALVRRAEDDLFSLGTAEAFAKGQESFRL